MLCLGAWCLALLSPEIFFACPGGRGFDVVLDEVVVLTVVVHADKEATHKVITTATIDFKIVKFLIFSFDLGEYKSTIKMCMSMHGTIQ